MENIECSEIIPNKKFRFEKDNDNSGWVYICSSDNLIKENIFKIGSTINLKSRLSSLNVSICQKDDKLWVYKKYFIKKYHNFEKLLHCKFTEKRLNGEFFNLGIVDFIDIDNILKSKVFDEPEIVEILPKEEKIHHKSISEISECILNKIPSLKDNYIYLKGKRYVFNEEFGIWNVLNKIETSHILRNLIDKYFTKLDFDVNYVKSNLNYLIKQFDGIFVRINFIDEFDLNQELLGLKSKCGGIFNLKIGNFVKTQPKDYVLTCCNWIYDENEAIKYYSEVNDFIHKLFPLPEIRKMVLKWVACSLNGRNNDKKALILTDDTNGDNGKSSFINLIRNTFDVYKIEGLKYLTLTRSSNKFKNENSHSSGLYNLKNKRLLCIDETE